MTQKKQQLTQLDEQLLSVLAEIEAYSPDELEQDLPHLKLQPLLDERQQLLAQLLEQSEGQDPEWLQQTLTATQLITTRAVVQLGASKQRFGGYKKGRKQVNRYQQIEAGKG